MNTDHKCFLRYICELNDVYAFINSCLGSSQILNYFCPMGYKSSHNKLKYHKMVGESLTPQEYWKICCQKYLQKV